MFERVEMVLVEIRNDCDEKCSRIGCEENKALIDRLDISVKLELFVCIEQIHLVSYAFSKQNRLLNQLDTRIRR